MLFLIPTPIGNLQDITLRALETLKTCDYILCEDTRRSRILLNKFEIDKPLKSFHKFNEKKEEDKILGDLSDGKNIALISDAGSPLICDPGADLVKRCYEENISVTALPGACSLIVALSLYPFPYSSFQFRGFLPKKQKELETLFKNAISYSGVSVFFESPERLLKTLSYIAKLSADTQVAVARELTKIYEECKTGTALKLLEYYQAHPPKGEIVLIIQGGKQAAEFQELDAEELVWHFVDQENFSIKEAIKKAAEIKKVDKKELYKLIHQD